LEAYYEWTNLQNNVQSEIYALEDSNNVDVSFEKFVEEFKQEYLPLIPDDILVDKTLLVKKISELYKAKGTPKAVQFLLKILYNVESEIFLPSSQIFKTSDATWNRDVTIRFKLLSGLLNSFDNVSVVLTTPTRIIDLELEKIIRVEDTSDIFEGFVAGNFKLSIPDGGTIKSDTFEGELVKSVFSKRILTPGIGYSIGDIFTIDSFGPQIKVTKTTPSSGLKAFEIIKYGNGYTADFEINIATNAIITGLLSSNLTIQQLNALNELYNQTKVNGDDNVNTIIEKLLITRFTYVDNPNYFLDNTYVGEILRSIDSITSSGQASNEFSARVAFQLGYVFEYPGYYSTNVGFPSDTSYLQDGEYYQQFSYVVKSDVQFENYENTVKTLVHPAGLRLFGEYTINRELNILVDVANQLSILEFNLLELVEANDEVVKVIMKSIEETATVTNILFKTLSKPITDNYNVSDTVFKTLTKTVLNLQTATDTLTKSVQKVLSHTVTSPDTIIKTVSKAVLDIGTTEDEGCAILNGYYSFTDITTHNDLYWACGYAEDEEFFQSTTELVDNVGDNLAVNNLGDTLRIRGTE
jgi:hypothetical protein